MLDLVVGAMAVILPALAISIGLVRTGRRYVLHKRIQIALASLLAVTVVLFEIDLRFFTDWRERAVLSPYYDPGTWNAVSWSLTIHLLFALPTAVLWAAVVIQALRRFPSPPAPCAQPGPPSLGLARRRLPGDDGRHRLGILLAGVCGADLGQMTNDE